MTKTSDEPEGEGGRGRAYGTVGPTCSSGTAATVPCRDTVQVTARAGNPVPSTNHPRDGCSLQRPSEPWQIGNPGTRFLQTTDGTRSTGSKLPAPPDGDGRSWSSPTPPPGSRLQLRTRPTYKRARRVPMGSVRSDQAHGAPPPRPPANESRNTRAHAPAHRCVPSLVRARACKKKENRCRSAARFPWWWVDRRRVDRSFASALKPFLSSSDSQPAGRTLPASSVGPWSVDPVVLRSTAPNKNQR